MIRVYKSHFAPFILSFIEQRHAFGYDYSEGEYTLYRFDRFCCDEFPDEKELTQKIILKWAERHEPENDRYRLNRIGTIRSLTIFMNSIGVDAYVLPYELSRKHSGQQHIPYIYSGEDLTLLFQTIDKEERNSRSPAKHLVFPVLYRLIYCCGLRPVEVRRLRCEDVDLHSGKITILESKGHKDRIVIPTDDVCALCEKYDFLVRTIYPDRNYFFPSPVDKGSAMYSDVTISHTFLHYLKTSGIYEKSGGKARLYDLRHTFATNVIHKWVKEGRNIDACLPYLSEYMGHATISETAYYIHLAPDAYPEMSSWDAGTSARIIREVQPCE